MEETKKKPAIGIDLGTTYSCVSVFQNGKPEVIANSQGNRTTPSMVAFTDKERLIGEGADVQIRIDPVNTIYNAKRFIGRMFNDAVVQENKSRYPFKIKENENKVNFQVKFLNANLDISPEEIASAILGKMKRTAEDHLEETIEDAVITVPAYFNDAQRQATKNAGAIAGLNVLRVINEPTAAAMAYGLQRKVSNDESINVLVYDLGGGTFDVSVLDISQEAIQVIATSGNTMLGGEDFNVKLVQHFKKEIFRKHQVDLTLYPRAVRRLTNACESIKRKLSATNVQEAKLELDALLPDGKDYTSSISRAKFEEICMDLFKSTITTVEKVLKDAGFKKKDIDEIVLVGGSTRIPKIQDILSKFFNNKSLNKSVNPDEAVACGAAIQAAILNKNQHSSIDDLLLLDVNPLSLGINLKGEITRVIIERNSLIPVQNTHGVQTSENFQTQICLQIVEGERSMTKDNKILGSFTIGDLPPRPAGEEKFQVIFDLNVDGILTASAIHKGSGKSKSITIDAKSSGRHSTEEINALVEKAEKMKVYDELEENRALSRNRLEAFCRNLQLEIQKNPNRSRTKLGSHVECTLEWILNNHDATEENFAAKYEELLEATKESDETLKDKGVEKGRRSQHIFRLSTFTSNYCIEAGDSCLRKTPSSQNFHEALEWFNKGYSIAVEKNKIDKMCLSLQKLGKTYRMIVENDEYFSEDEQVEDGIIQNFIHGVGFLGMGLEWSQNKRGIGKDVIQTMIEDLQFFKDEFFEEVVPNLEGEKMMIAIHLFLSATGNAKKIHNVTWRQIVSEAIHCQLEYITVELQQSMEQEDLKAALHHLGEIRQPIENYLQLETAFPLESLTDRNITETIEFVEKFSRYANALQQINLSEEILDNMKDAMDIDDKINLSLFALDHIKEAKNMTKDNLKIFCKAKLYEGKVYLNLLPNKEKAKNCFREVLNIGITQQYTNTIWYKEASNIFQKLKQEEVVEEPKKDRTAIMKELEKEIAKLDVAKKLSDEEFVKFLFANFPPKHKENAKMPEVSQTHQVIKKAYIKLSTFYHPDKIDNEMNGEKYKVFCEEISKRVNSRYAQMKSND